MAFSGLNFKVKKNTEIDYRPHFFQEETALRNNLYSKNYKILLKSGNIFRYYRFAKAVVTTKIDQKWASFGSNLKVQKKAKNESRTALEFEE